MNQTHAYDERNRPIRSKSATKEQDVNRMREEKGNIRVESQAGSGKATHS